MMYRVIRSLQKWILPLVALYGASSDVVPDSVEIESDSFGYSLVDYTRSCHSLLTDLRNRGLTPDRPRLFALEEGKALHRRTHLGSMPSSGAVRYIENATCKSNFLNLSRPTSVLHFQKPIQSMSTTKPIRH